MGGKDKKNCLGIIDLLLKILIIWMKVYKKNIRNLFHQNNPFNSGISLINLYKI